MSQIVTTAKPHPPTVSDRALMRSLPQVVERLLGMLTPFGEYPATASISSELRQQMVRAAGSLEATMGEKDLGREAKAVTLLLSSFSRQAASAEASDLLFAGYEMALEGVPSWAVEEAVHGFITGRLGRRDFAPSPPNLRIAADQEVKILRGKIITLRKLAAARVEGKPTEEQRQRLAELIKGLRWKTMDEEEAPTAA
jgi:hypothetical protein